MRSLSSLDIHYLCNELKFLEGSKVEKIVQSGKDFFFRLYKEGSKHTLRFNPEGFFHLTNKRIVAPRTPPGYCTFLRKYLKSSNLQSLEQVSFERIVKLVFSYKDDVFELFIELFSPGNVVLVKDGLIMHPLERQRFKSRSLDSKKSYVMPSQKINLKTLSETDFFKEAVVTKELGRFLAVDLGLGGVYSEELVKRTGLDKSIGVNELRMADKRLVFNEIKNLLSNDLKPILSSGEVYPFPLKNGSGVEKEFVSYSEAYDYFFEYSEQESVVSKKEKKDKLSSMIDIQQKRILDLEKEAEENARIGDYIYANYSDFDKLVKTLWLVKEESGWDGVSKKVKELKNYVGFDKKNKKLSLEFK